MCLVCLRALLKSLPRRKSALCIIVHYTDSLFNSVKASQLLRQIARGLKIQLKVPPPTDYGDRLRVRVVPQSRPPYELQRRSSLSSKGEQQDWTALAAQAYMPNSNGDIPLRIPAGIGGNAVFSQSSVRGSGNESSVMQSPQDEFPPPSSLLSNLLGEASASRPGTAGTFKPFNPWSPASATSGLPHDADAMSDLLAPFGLTYVDPLEDNFTSSNANGGLKDNLFGFMTNNFSTY